MRRETHLRDAAGLRAVGQEALAAELDRSWGDYEGALERLRSRGGDLLAALAPHAQWTSSATHAILPLLATDTGVRLQVESGVASHRRRFSAHWHGGFWLPECAYAPWLERALEDAGVGAVCVELTSRLGLGADEHLRPIATESGVLLVPIDRATMSLVWSEEGYPAAGPYRDYHHHTAFEHKPWSNAGDAYDRDAAAELAQTHAAEFVARTIERLRGAAPAERADRRVRCWSARSTRSCSGTGGMRAHWLRAVVEECARRGSSWCAWTRRSHAATPRRPGQARRWEGAWATRSGRRAAGAGAADLSTWSAPPVADMAFAARAAELAFSPPAGEPATAPCASCSRCSPATGPSWSPRDSRRRMGRSALTATWTRCAGR